jgi:ribosomal protein L37AE/L43A
MLGFGIPFVIGGLAISLVFFHENIWSFLGFAIVVVPGGLWCGYRFGGQQWDASQKKRANARNSTSETSFATSEKQSPAQVIDAEFMEEAIVPCGNCGKKNRLHRSARQGLYRCGSCKAALADPFTEATVASGIATVPLICFIASQVIEPVVKN